MFLVIRERNHLTFFYRSSIKTVSKPPAAIIHLKEIKKIVEYLYYSLHANQCDLAIGNLNVGECRSASGVGKITFWLFGM
jgi:hypothetical protein